jgi:hypothetical protein
MYCTLDFPRYSYGVLHSRRKAMGIRTPVLLTLEESVVTSNMLFQLVGS